MADRRLQPARVAVLSALTGDGAFKQDPALATAIPVLYRVPLTFWLSARRAFIPGRVKLDWDDEWAEYEGEAIVFEWSM